MPNKRLSMRKIREVLRLLWGCQKTTREVAASVGIAPSTVLDYKYRASAARLNWPLKEEFNDTELELLLFPVQKSNQLRPAPDWAHVLKELKSHKGMTLQLIWIEYKEANPEGYQYSRFCDLFRKWRKTIDIAMRQEHLAGEKIFVDYAGTRVPVWDPVTQQVREANIFVAVLGASNYLYAEATWTQSLIDWIGSHVRTFEFFGGVSDTIVPDNLKSGVKRPCFYEPEINTTYLDMSQHYDTVIVPARVRKPKDKANGEKGVQLVTRWVLAPLRNVTFCSLGALNRAISVRVRIINNRPFKRIPGTRKELFEKLDKPALKPLPVDKYVFSQFKKAMVNVDYHIQLEGHYYSVPYQYRKKKVEARYTQNTVEIFYKNERIASHRRNFVVGHFTTTLAHMPPNHRAYKEWSPKRFKDWASKYGENVVIMVERILSLRPHPTLGFRACMGLLKLADKFGAERLNAACNRALKSNAISCRSVRLILKSGLDKRKEKPIVQAEQIEHDNIRGEDYYNDIESSKPLKAMEVN